MVAKRIFPILLACLLIQLTGCKKEDDRNLMVSFNNITFDYDDDSQLVTVSNVGPTEFTWTVSTASDLMEFSKTSGTCAKNNPEAFEINVLRERVHQDSIQTSVVITASTGETATIKVLILGFPEKKIRYNSQVHDAEYDPIHNRLIILTSLNNARVLDIYDLGTGRFSHLAIPGTGSSLSVSPDGTYALTGSDNNSKITYTDLVQMKVISTYGVGEYNYEFIATPDRVCYYFPQYNNSNIGRLDLASGTYASYSFGLYDDPDIAVLHPAGNYIYTADSYMLTKYKISSPQPSVNYTSSYNTGSKIWMSKDGASIFTATKRKLNIDVALPQIDVTSIENVTLAQSYIHALEHNMVHGEYYIIPTNSSYGSDYQSGQLVVLNDDLLPVRTILLEPFYFENYYSQGGYVTEDAVGEYIFSSSDGAKIIVVSMSGDYYSGSWGIEIIDRNW